MHIPERLQGLEWELPHNFLGLSPEDSDFAKASSSTPSRVIRCARYWLW